jgi:hypothetical protein
MVNLVPSPINLVDQVVNMVSSSIEPLTQVVDPVPSLVSPTLHLKSAKVVDPVSSLINPTPQLKSAKVVDTVPPSVDPTPPLKSATKVVDPVPSSFDPTPHSKSEDVASVYLVNIDSPGQGGTPPISMAPLSSNEMISFNWNHLAEPYLPSYVPFQITVQVFDKNIPNTVIDEGSFVSILSTNAWNFFGSP